MLVLLVALAAGAATAVSPCALPILPAILVTGTSRRQAAAMIAGLVVSFVVVVAGLGALLVAIGAPDSVLRYGAAAVFAVVAVSLLVPRAGDVLQRPFYRLGRFAPREKGESAGRSMLVGVALGAVYAPCAGPILAAVVAGSATGETTGFTLAVAVAYGLGTGAALFAVALLGSRATRRLDGHRVHQAVGAVFLVMAVAFGAGLDARFQTAIASGLPAWLVNPTGSLERSVADDLGGTRLGDGDPAPDLAGIEGWINSEPLTLDGLEGRVVLVDFWTYSCINCIRVTPQLKAWHEQYEDDGLTIIGVHTPEFAFERSPENVERAVRDAGIRYPVALDPDYETWQAFGNRAWPTKYLIDARGEIRYVHEGEGAYEETETQIRALLAEAGRRPTEERTDLEVERATEAGLTPETYFGLRRADRIANLVPSVRPQDYEASDRPLEADLFELDGRWRVEDEFAAPIGSGRVVGRVRARRVFAVLAPPAGGGEGRVCVEDEGGSRRCETVDGQRLYRLLDRGEVRTAAVTLELSPGTRIFTVTTG